ncbi:MAG: type II secretion system protein [Chloroflexi bacterium]|nr:MAG: type II secretion system protein [Chloroflexota bacterium]
MNTLNKNEKGFTIIEVVLVLAIAGLIFLMVFIALPALQRSQRNTQRTQDLNRISTQVTTYMSSTRKPAPTDPADFQSKYLIPADEYMDPTGTSYSLISGNLPGEAGGGQIKMTPSATCDGDTTKPAAPRQFALQIRLEGQSVPYCLDNK